MNYAAIALERTATEPLYQQLATAISRAIAAGDLPPGERLPSERDLAALLGISRTTAVNAYRELEARGLLRGYVGRGTFVCAGPEYEGAPFAWRGKVALGARRTVEPTLRAFARYAADPEVVPFGAGMSALDIFPVELFNTLAARVLRRGALTALALGPTEGQPRLRRVLAARAGLKPEQVLVVSGAQQALDLVGRCLLDPGDTVVMDRPGYLGAIQAFRAVGANLVGWDIQRADPDELEDLILRYRPKLLYTNPTFQNPTGRTLSLRDRRDLLDLATRYRLPVIEDQTYQDLSLGDPPPPSLFALDAGSIVIQVNSFSKSLAGGLRLGWMAAAEAIVDQLALIKQRTDVCSPSLEQLIVAELLATHHYDDHLRALRREHLLRRDAMAAALRRHIDPAALTFTLPHGGMFLWCRLGQGIEARELAREALAAGVTIVSGDLFYPDQDGAGRHELRLCFTAAPPARIDDGARRLATVMGLDRVRERRTELRALV